MVEAKPILDYLCHLNVCKILDHFNILFKRFIFICYATTFFLYVIIFNYTKQRYLQYYGENWNQIGYVFNDDIARNIFIINFGFV